MSSFLRDVLRHHSKAPSGSKELPFKLSFQSFSILLSSFHVATELGPCGGQCWRATGRAPQKPLGTRSKVTQTPQPHIMAYSSRFE